MSATMTHQVIYKRDGYYSAFPQLSQLPDGRIALGFPVSRFHDHACIGEWVVLVSAGDLDTWVETDDPAIPFNWPAETVRERVDRFAAVMSDGAYLSAGSSGYTVWPAERRREAEDQDLDVREHPADADSITVGGHNLFVQRSTDGGRNWSRRVWDAAAHRLLAFSRPAHLADGAILVPLYDGDPQGGRSTYVFRSGDGGRTWRFLPMGPHAQGVLANETALLEVSAGRVLALSRTATAASRRQDYGYLVESWSDDSGLSWPHSLRTPIWGWPPHLLKLGDGRILCSYGYRRAPMGVRAVISHDSGETWDTENEVVLRADGGTPSQLQSAPASAASDVGYPISAQLPDGSIFTVYYITLDDGVTHIAATRWTV